MDAPSKASGPKPHGEQLLTSILQDVVTPSQINALYSERLRDKKLQLANPDRPRPVSTDPKAASKLRKRRKRVKMELAQMKRIRIQSTGQDPTEVADRQRQLASVKRELVRASRPSSGKKRNESGSTPLSRAQRKRLGLEQVDRNVSYQLILPLNKLWSSYIQQLLNITTADSKGNITPNPQFSVQSLNTMGSGAVSSVQASLMKADLCGAHIQGEPTHCLCTDKQFPLILTLYSALPVVRSSNPSLVNISGLVVKETERTIAVIQEPPSDSGAKPSRAKGESLPVQPRSPTRSTLAEPLSVTVVPKQNSVFALHVPLPPQSQGGKDASLRFELHGNHMMHTLPSRVTRKYKARATVDF